jgi:hypothetical protein
MQHQTDQWLRDRSVCNFESLRTELTLTDRDERSCMPDHNVRRVDMSKTKISKKGSKVDMSPWIRGESGAAGKTGVFSPDFVVAVTITPYHISMTASPLHAGVISGRTVEGAL